MVYNKLVSEKNEFNSNGGFISSRDAIRLKDFSSLEYVAIRVDQRRTRNSQRFVDDQYSEQKMKDKRQLPQWT